ncbi:FAD binding domain-containing protein [Lawsonibacter sp. LCP25S3_G6]|uniref:FAD binding domain-containing protein n=1 Tax=unclassified Lawsonibacter TaxID=2617946 RepID=UPI003F97DAE6
MARTEYLQPGTLEDLKNLLPTLPTNTAVLAGGTDLMPQIRTRHPDYECILSLWNIPDLRVVEETTDGYLKIGAMVTHAAAADNHLIRRYFRGLYMACSHVGSQQVRNKGTLGGSLVNASPAGDIAPCIFLYHGQLEILSQDGSRRVDMDEFLFPDGKTCLQQGEILTAIYLPIDKELNSCFVKLGSRREVTIAQISLCAAWKNYSGKPEVLSAFVGAIDRRPCAFPNPGLLADLLTAEQAAQLLADQIRQIRLKRTRPPKLKLTEAEQLYKERAAKGVVYDVVELIGAAEL